MDGYCGLLKNLTQAPNNYCGLPKIPSVTKLVNRFSSTVYLDAMNIFNGHLYCQVLLLPLSPFILSWYNHLIRNHVYLEYTTAIKQHYSYIQCTQHFPLALATLHMNHQSPYLSRDIYRQFFRIFHHTNAGIYFIQPIYDNVHTHIWALRLLLLNILQASLFQKCESSLLTHPNLPTSFRNDSIRFPLFSISSHSY